MGLLTFLKVREEVPDNLDLLEPLIRGTAYSKGADAPRHAALAMSELLDPRAEMQALDRHVDARTSAQFSEMADPAAVEHLLSQLRR